jgi:hypothetical protein
MAISKTIKPTIAVLKVSILSSGVVWVKFVGLQKIKKPIRASVFFEKDCFKEHKMRPKFPILGVHWTFCTCWYDPETFFFAFVTRW